MNPGLPVIPAKAGIHVVALKVGPRFRGDDGVGLAWGSRSEARPTGGGLAPTLRGVGRRPYRIF